MALAIWCEFVCSVCAHTAPGRHVVGGRIPIREMKREAEREGFRFTDMDAFCSKRCKEEFEANQ